MTGGQVSLHGSGSLQVTAAAPSRDARVTDLSLKKSGRRRDDHYDVIADGAVVGRIMLFTANPTELPWVWTIAPGYEEGRSTTHGYAKTLEAATQGGGTLPKHRPRSPHGRRAECFHTRH